MLVELGAPWKCVLHCIGVGGVTVTINNSNFNDVLNEEVVSLGKELNVVIELAFNLFLLGKTAQLQTQCWLLLSGCTLII